MASKIKNTLLNAIRWTDKDQGKKTCSFNRDYLIRAIIEQSSDYDLNLLTPGEIETLSDDFVKIEAKRKQDTITLEIKPMGSAETQTTTSVKILCKDMPFLVSTINNALLGLKINPRLTLHPTLSIADKPKLSAVWIHIPRYNEEQNKALEKALRQGLNDNILAVADWEIIQKRMHEALNRLKKDQNNDHSEAIKLGEWMIEGHFTFTGFREHHYSLSGKNEGTLSIPNKSGAGVLRDPNYLLFQNVKHGMVLPEQHRAADGEFVRVTKANFLSTVHRHKHIDVVAIKKTDDKGNILGEDIFAGLFTSNAYMNNISDIPIIRKKMQNLCKKMDIRPLSHNARILEHILNIYPRDDLWQIDENLLGDHASVLMEIMEHPRLRLLIRRDPFDHFIITHIYIPCDSYEMQLRQTMTSIIEKAFGGTVTSFDVHISGETLARMILIVKTQPGKIPSYKEAAIEADLTEAARPWKEKLEEPLFKNFSDSQAQYLLDLYGASFAPGYRSRFQAENAVKDIALILEAKKDPNAIAFDFQEDHKSGKLRALLKIYRIGAQFVLSDFMPFLDSAGLRALSEELFLISPTPQDGTIHEDIFLHVFSLEIPEGMSIEQTRKPLITMLRALRETPSQSDPLNNLILSGVSWEEVCLLRALVAYMRQGGFPLPDDIVRDCLIRHKDFIHQINALFHALFNPETASKNNEKKITALIENQLSAVSSLEEDRILRALLSVVQAIQRTNFYQQEENGQRKPFISFKLLSRMVDFLPAPRPFYEIFVYSPRFEAVHLRFGKVARGGLRWSDRRADFRTEVLGLVKAQQVKNAVIIPVGSKGGFVPKNTLIDRQAFLKEGVACYSLFINAMLDITDNLKQQKIVFPKNLVRRDGDDPYLVVAADKGTATLSDTANKIATDKGFWLGDAFASGGSAGYDHKKMGITARGAWESVKHHFWQMNHNTQSQPFDVIGVGDMSGDVFGNGMLLSEHIRLIAAFNHLHIFIDPTPDPQSSFQERKRLFALARSSWDDYNRDLISKGGGIFSRQEKSLALNEQIRKRFDISEKSLTPDQLILHILRAETDLLWFGGIGTYIKAEEESHMDVSDHANDSVRIDAGEVRARVIGEGANLGMTQKSRIICSKQDRKCNSDAIDNSAGVDCSDHEVNIKILLGDAINSGDLAEKDRNSLLKKMTQAVGDHVLLNNYQQNNTLSMIEAHRVDRLDSHQQHIRLLEREGHLNRELESLPNDEEIEELRRSGKGLTRPELCVLLAYTKNIAYQEILDSNLPDEDFLEFALFSYFPENLHKPFRDQIKRHQLRREIIATWLSNNLINDAGITLVSELQRRKNLPVSEIARAWLIVRDLFDIDALKTSIKTLDMKASAKIQTHMLFEISQLILRTSEWMLSYEKENKIDAVIKKYKPDFQILEKLFQDLFGPSLAEEIHTRKQRFQDDNVPKKISDQLCSLKMRSTFCEIIYIANSCNKKSIDVAKCYFAFSERFMIDQLRSGANALVVHNRWERMARNAMIDDLWSLQGKLSRQAIQAAKNPAHAINEWLDQNQKASEMIDNLNNEIYHAGRLDISKVVIASRMLGELVK